MELWVSPNLTCVVVFHLYSLFLLPWYTIYTFSAHGVFVFAYLTPPPVTVFCCTTGVAHRYTILNVVGSPPQNVAVGRVNKEGFVPFAGMAKVVWPGGTTRIPQDTQRSMSDPVALSIGWVMETAWGTPALQQESRMYAQQAIDEINADLYILPNTHLTLEGDFSVNGNDKTAEAFNAVDARATAAGRPLAAVLAGSSSHMVAIYAPQANVTVTRPSTGVPIVGYYTGAAVLSDSKKFPNFIRLYPPVSEYQHIYRKMAVRFIYPSRTFLSLNKKYLESSLFSSLPYYS